MTDSYVSAEAISSVRHKTNRSLGNIGYTKTISIRNNLPGVLTVCERHGVPMQIPPLNTHGRKVIFEVEIKFAPGTVIDPDGRFFKEMSDCPEKAALMAAFEQQQIATGGTRTRNENRANRVIVLEYTVEYEQFAKMGNNIYLKELDVVISLDEEGFADHPYTHYNNRLHKIVKETNTDDIDGFHIDIKIISNDGSYGDKFINFNGMVYRVPSTANNSLNNGVYIYGNDAHNRSSSKNDVRWLSYEDAEQLLGLYNTRAEAESLGGTNNENERKLEQLKRENKEQELNLTLLKRELEQRTTEEAIELNKVKAENARLAELRSRDLAEAERVDKLEAFELEEQRRRNKFAYEERSAQLKNTSELIKYGPAILAGAIAIGGLVWKLSR